MKQKLVIVVPAYNEDQVIESVIESIKEQLPILTLADLSPEIIVVDDGSTDSTFNKAQSNGVFVLKHIFNCGLGAALGTGFYFALKRDATIVVTMDSDGQHDQKDISRLISPILNNTADFVIGSRQMNSAGMPIDRRIINRVANFITWLLFGVKTTDSQSGFRALNRYTVEHINLKTNRMEVSSELVAEARRLKVRLVDVPIKTIYTTYSRNKGQTNANSISILIKLFLRKLR
jgi:glycosyltransferase involved in cell wall biosynthesis